MPLPRSALSTPRCRRRSPHPAAITPPAARRRAARPPRDDKTPPLPEGQTGDAKLGVVFPHEAQPAGPQPGQNILKKQATQRGGIPDGLRAGGGLITARRSGSNSKIGYRPAGVIMRDGPVSGSRRARGRDPPPRLDEGGEEIDHPSP